VGLRFLVNHALGAGSGRNESSQFMFNATVARKPLGTLVHTGETCPESGDWRVVSMPSTTAPIAKGNRMPPYYNQAVVWELIRYA